MPTGRVIWLTAAPTSPTPMNPPTARLPAPEPAFLIVPSPSGSAKLWPSRSIDARSVRSDNAGATNRVFEFASVAPPSSSTATWSSSLDGLQRAEQRRGRLVRHLHALE